MRTILPLALVVLTACQSAPAPRPAAPTSVEELLHYCQARTGANFTYTAETGTLLRERGFRLVGSDQRTAEAWMELLRGVLREQQLELERIGPEHIEVWLVRPVRKRD
jgi:hypothetical protein